MNTKNTIYTLLSIIGIISAGNWVPISNGSPKDAEIILESSDIQSSVLTFKTEGFWMTEVNTTKGTAVIVETEKGTPMLDAHSPDLEKLTTSVIIPDSDEMAINILNAEFTEYTNIFVAPSKGNILRTMNPDDIPFQFGEIYEQDAFFPGQLADLRDPYILRDFRGQTVIAYPFQYNPVQKILRVYHSITVEVITTGQIGINVKEFTRQIPSFTKEYENMYSEHFENFNVDRYEVLAEQGNMLVVSYGSFMDEMEPLVHWKNIKGVPTEMVSVTEAGGSANSIKNFVEDYYYSNGLTFLLLVGDISQVPSLTVGGAPSDPSYGFIEGNDSYPEIIVGRFSSENTSHVNTQVERVINYERYPAPSGDWYMTSLGVASDQGPGDDGEIDCEHVENINEVLGDFTYEESSSICDPSGSVSQGMNAINNGVSVINYTGHGSDQCWGNGAPLCNSDVNNLENNGKLPFIWSVACVNGAFQNGTCLGEAWLRATNDGEPSGAMAFYGSTVNQAWAPPMEGQDAFNDILAETYEDNIKRTYGGLSANGCMQMNDSYGSSGEYETNYWTLFGDPSLMVRTAEPEDLIVDHPNIVMIGTTNFEVSAGQEGSLSALSKDGVLKGYAYADASGLAQITFDEPINDAGEMKLIVTGFNCMPYEVDLMAMSPEGPYVVVEEVNLVGEGNDNGLVDWGEYVAMEITASNVGVDPASDVTAYATSEDPFLHNFGGSVSFSDISPDGISVSDDPISFAVTQDAPEGHTASVDVYFSGSDQFGEDYEWISNFAVTIYHNCVSGDVNADGAFNILDIVRMVNLIINFGDPASEFEDCSAEVNGDETINILDIITLINIILDNERPIFSETADYSTIFMGDNSVNISADGPIAGIQLTVVTENLAINPDMDMNIAVNEIDGVFTVLIYSIEGNVITNNIQLFTTTGEFDIPEIIVANTDGQNVLVDFDALPENYTLHQNFPNPFNPVTTIGYTLTSDSHVSLTVMDLMGKEVTTLINEVKPLGYHTIQWNGTNSSGNLVPSGIYVYQLKSNDGILNRKMVLMK